MSPKYLINIHTNPGGYPKTQPVKYEFYDKETLNSFLKELICKKNKIVRETKSLNEYKFYCTDFREFVNEFNDYCYSESYTFMDNSENEEPKWTTCEFDLLKKTRVSVYKKNMVEGNSEINKRSYPIYLILPPKPKLISDNYTLEFGPGKLSEWNKSLKRITYWEVISEMREDGLQAEAEEIARLEQDAEYEAANGLDQDPYYDLLDGEMSAYWNID